ncbi:hypothetical protein DSCA_43310 [Desulfosarcina alkanivorans]|uniref:Uncharacterized protein n=1 Tax=Desulfosarcina alkanivorans TaxID=571177 RepID=A0A5K7YTP0_9BACT|nr:hypothetical protein DSCA_43310 [Desulfosarcina alkanivorans]
MGVSIEWADAELTSAIDWGTALTANGISGFTPQGIDGKAKIEGDDWGFGANVGLIFEPLAGTRLGLHYRSKIDHTLEGDATFNTPAAVLATGVPQASGRVDTSVKADFAYGHLFVDDPEIDKDVTELENRLRGALVGEYDASVDIISASVSFRF